MPYVGRQFYSMICKRNGSGAVARAAIWEARRDRQVAHLRERARNPNGLSWETAKAMLCWAVVNERDEIGPDLVPDYEPFAKDALFTGRRAITDASSPNQSQRRHLGLQGTADYARARISRSSAWRLAHRKCPARPITAVSVRRRTRELGTGLN